ncbi:MAG: hypothetical protein WD405_11395 [Homoserinimonas sp.]
MADPDGAWVEFSTTRRLGPASVELLIKLTRQVAARTSFPPPPQHREWNRQAILDFIGGMVEGKKGVKFVAAAALKARDQPSFERQLLTSIENWLKDLSKMTVVGRMRRRLNTLLGQDQRFLRASTYVGADAWSLSVLAQTVWQGDEDYLFTATTRKADDGLQELNIAGKTSSHNAKILVGYSHHVLATALGALRDQLLARFVVRRYALDEPLLSGYSDDVIDGTTGRHVVEDEILVLDAMESILAILEGRDEPSPV